MNKTSIEWTDYTWNPVTGCSKISQGCKHCYADTMNTRFGKGKKFTDVIMHENRLEEPLKMRDKLKGKRVFVCDVSDLFHDHVSNEFITRVVEVMELLPDTTFQILTKRAERMNDFFNDYYNKEYKDGCYRSLSRNIHKGVSCENQKEANERIPHLLYTPSRFRFLSCEPLLGPINIEEAVRLYFKKFDGYYYNIQDIHSRLHWVIAGGESGNRNSVRPMHPDWVRSLRDQCALANVPFFFKQWGDFLPIGQDQWVSENEFFDFTIYNHKEFYHKLGKSKAGNYLDGKQHLNFPMV